MADSIRGRVVVGPNGVANVRLLINHPMAIERRDPATGQLIPPHFIEELTIEHKGETVFSALWGQAVSQNPYLALSITGVGKGDVITVKWRDNKGDSDSAPVTAA